MQYVNKKFYIELLLQKEGLPLSDNGEESST